METTAVALNHFPIVDTHDAEVMREIMLTRFGAARFETASSGTFFGRSAVAHLGSVSLVVCAYGAPSLAVFDEADFVRLQLAFSGAARTTVGGQPFEVSRQQSCVTPANRPCKIEFNAGYQQILVRIDQSSMERKIANMLGSKPRGRLEFLPGLEENEYHLRGLKNLIRFIAGELAASPQHLKHFLAEELEETLVAAFLKTVPSSFSKFLHAEPSDDTPANVRLVEEYIDANWQLPISMERLAKITGVGTRSIFATFKRRRGYTPFAYLKTVRLRNAYELLRCPSETTSVTDVALSCGFTNLGHFAHQYQQAIGELPSLTLARARRLSP